jgi:AraC-like DNA-binding protein
MVEDSTKKLVAIAAYGRTIAAALEQRGIDAAKVFESAGVHLPTTTDPMRRMSNAEISALFRESYKVTQDPYFGLFVADCFHIGNLHALGFALLASSTFRDFFLRLQNYYRLASQNVAFALGEDDDNTVVLSAKLLNPDICGETVDAFAALIVRMMRAISDQQMAPLRVELARPEPGEGDQPYRDYFSCDVLFDRPEICICIDSDLIDKPLPGASKELAQMHDKTAMEYLARLEKQDISGRVRTAIVDSLSTGLVSKKLVAEKLHMSLRSLDLKLGAENTSFQRTLDSTRQSLATGYIEQSSFSITEIAYLLGFSDAANFTRAFKRWTGKSPLEFRKSLGLPH